MTYRLSKAFFFPTIKFCILTKHFNGCILDISKFCGAQLLVTTCGNLSFLPSTKKKKNLP